MVQRGSIGIGVDGGMTAERARSRIGEWRDDEVEHGFRGWWRYNETGSVEAGLAAE